MSFYFVLFLLDGWKLEMIKKNYNYFLRTLDAKFSVGMCVFTQILVVVLLFYTKSNIFWEDGVWTKFERETIEQKANDSGIRSFLAIVQLSWKLCLLYTYLLLQILN